LFADKQADKGASVYPLLYRLSLPYASVFVAAANNDAFISIHLSYEI